MADQAELSATEHLKEASLQLRGTLAEELAQDVDHFSDDAKQLLKFHGSYQQDDRDARKRPGREGRGDKDYMFMVRSRIPGGKVTAEQFLAELDLCDRFGNGTLRVTTRQGFQLHGVLKHNLRETIREINRIKLSTLAACGDVERNVMCCPAPFKTNAVRQQMQDMCDRVAEHLKPRTTAYYEIWLRDPETGEEIDVTDFKPVDEPIYGARYLPRKFKTAFALPEDNCIDVYSNDLGFLAIAERGGIAGYNVLVGGGMGVTPTNKNTFPAIAKRMAFITPDQVLGVAESIVKVQRDFGNRADRKLARMKYLIANWGLEAFKSKVEEYYGRKLPAPHPADVTGADDHMGWHEQGDGRWFLGVNIENGRIQDTDDLRLKTALRTILQKYGIPTRTTALQAVLLCEIEPAWRNEIDRILRDHGVKSADELTPARRLSIACPALPTCGLSVTESERVMPAVMDQIEAELARIGLPDERVAVHMTGCPNGCARPYTPDIGLVGKSRLKYTLFLGGNVEGTRLAFVYKDMVPLEQIGETLAPLFAAFKDQRSNGESFGDFCWRQGTDGLRACAEPLAAAAAVPIPVEALQTR
jgi:sulfite reductase (ferredoxin)